MAAKKKSEHEYNASGVLFIGCIMLGWGLGIWANHAIAGLFSGIGVGFIAMAFFTRTSIAAKRPKK